MRDPELPFLESNNTQINIDSQELNSTNLNIDPYNEEIAIHDLMEQKTIGGYYD